MKNENLLVVSILGTSMILILVSIGVLSVSGHERRLYTIGDQDYLFVVGSMNEPAFVDDKSGVEVFAWWPDPTDPMNSQANETKPIEGLTLKTDVSAGGKNITLIWNRHSVIQDITKQCFIQQYQLHIAIQYMEILMVLHFVIRSHVNLLVNQNPPKIIQR